MSGGKKVNRRTAVKTIGVAIGGLAVGAAIGWFAKPAERILTTTTVERPVTHTTTVSYSPTVTSPTKTWKPWYEDMPRPGNFIYKKYPWTKDILGVSEDEFMYGYDWARNIDWEKVRGKFQGKKIVCTWEGTATDVPEFYKPLFEKLTGCQIEVVAIPTELLHEKIMADLVSGKGAYDVMAAYFGWGLAYTPYLYNLKEFFEQYELDIREYHPFCLMPNIMGLDGSLYGLVSDADMWATTVRLNLLEKYAKVDKVPDTWEEFLAVADSLKTLKEKEGIYPVIPVYNAIGFPCAMSWIDMAFQFEDFSVIKYDEGSWEPDFLGKDGGGREALEIFKKLIDMGPPDSLSYVYAEARDVWLAGKGAMIVGWTCLPHLSHYPDISKISPYFTDNVIACGPVPKGTIHRQPGIWPCTAAAINKASKNPELAFLYTLFMLSQEAMSVLMLGSPSENHVGFKTAIADPRLWKLSPGHREAQYKWGWSAALSPFCFLPESYEIAEAIGKELHPYLRGELADPDVALRNAEKAARTILERGGYLGPKAPPLPPLTLEEWCKKVGLENWKPVSV